MLQDRQEAARHPGRGTRFGHLDAERYRRSVKEDDAPVDTRIDILPTHQAEDQEGGDADESDDDETQMLRQEYPAEDGQREDEDGEPSRRLERTVHDDLG